MVFIYASKKIELSEVMIAMDVVDTLRHQRSLVERELQSEDREADLIEKQRRITVRVSAPVEQMGLIHRVLSASDVTYLEQGMAGDRATFDISIPAGDADPLAVRDALGDEMIHGVEDVVVGEVPLSCR